MDCEGGNRCFILSDERAGRNRDADKDKNAGLKCGKKSKRSCMNFSVDDVRCHIMANPRVVEETPFGPEVLVYKILGKIFATLRFEDEVGQMNLKCDPERALQLRDEHETILPGYHMNKKHWNTLILDGSLSSHLVGELIDLSYQLVVKGMPKKTREIL